MNSGFTANPDLHLVVGGHRIEPVEQDGLSIFRIPLPARDVRLVSRAERPQEIGISDDPRLLGFGVTQLMLEQDGTKVNMPIAAPELLDGFYECEHGAFRWTNGNAVLPNMLFAGAHGVVTLGVGGFALPTYRMRADTAAANAALFLEFESLGEDCEFGLAQRHFDAEPSSLLRWAGTDVPRLIAGLSSGFAGFGESDHTELVWSDAAGEYKLDDARYLRAHTWSPSRLSDPAAEAELRQGGLARLRLLRRKLLADIAQARRIFVYKDTGPDSAAFRSIHAALRHIGPATLLYVRQATSEADVGRVDAPGDGLFIGHIDRFVLGEGPYDVWHQLCETTLRLHRVGRGLA
jgi:hypothetical protein